MRPLVQDVTKTVDTASCTADELLVVLRIVFTAKDAQLLRSLGIAPIRPNSREKRRSS
jgi:hypothetical protein